MKYTIAYRNEGNLGNTIQTLGLTYLISPSLGMWYDNISPMPNKNDILICNGWFGTTPQIKGGNAIFFGMHISDTSGPLDESLVKWLRESNKEVGTRDPNSAVILNNMGIKAKFVGCGSLMFPKYNGKRSGEVCVDFDGPGTHYTHNIDPSMPWKDKWDLSLKMIDIYKTAKVVYTNRLHVALPCLALGTPVYVVSNTDTTRFSILETLGVNFDNISYNVNVNDIKAIYKEFMETQLNEKLTIQAPQLPKITELTHQKLTTTSFDRYADIFIYIADNFYNIEKLMSFGCSTGEECFTLNKYFPQKNIVGVEINESALNVAIKNNSDKNIKFVKSIHESSNVDIIFAMSVLCNWGGENDTSGLDYNDVYSFDQFNDQLIELDKKLNLGGIFVIYNSNYYFEDSDIFENYIPINRNFGNEFVTKFDSAGWISERENSNIYVKK